MWNRKRAWRRIAATCRRLWRLLQEKGIEPLEESTLTWVEWGLYFWVYAVREFFRNRCPFRATALAYTTLLALVPLLALMVSLATSLFREYYTEEKITHYIDKLVAYVAPQLDLVPAEETGPLKQGKLPEKSAGKPEKVQAPPAPTAAPSKAAPPQSEADPESQPPKAEANAPPPRTGREAVAQTISRAIQNVQSGGLSVSGVLGLIVVAIMLLATIEAAFNEIWGVTQGRSWSARLVLYWTAISLGPITLLALGLLVGDKLQATTRILNHLPLLKRFIFGIMPYILVAICFAVWYKLIPNTSVQWRAAFLGGAVGGSLWVANNLVQAKFVSRVVNASAIYGPLASLPIFLVGLYMSWLALLFGAQTAYLWQNRRVYWQEQIAQSTGQEERELAAVTVMARICYNFFRGAPPPTLIELADAVGAPSQLVAQVLNPLLASGLAAQAQGRSEGYLPGRPLEKITLADVLRTMRQSGTNSIQSRGQNAVKAAAEALARIRRLETEAAAGVTFFDLAAKEEEKRPQASSDASRAAA
ncbi:MAG: YihY family inner membrane protein [Verrucomicrobia bacterium]|nr:YihY family inner membrane protein [Verrucomicrobiota bacterium]